MVEVIGDSWGMPLLVVLLAAASCGFAKTGIATLGIVHTVLMVQIFPAREAAGTLLPMLIAADIAAVVLYRRHVVWRHLLALLPSVAVGMVGGYLLLTAASDTALRRILGSLLLLLVALQLLKERRERQAERTAAPASGIFTTVMGALAGFATTVGNVSGVAMSIYFVGKRLSKEVIIGTGAWFYLAVNVVKVPLFVQLGMITPHSLFLNLLALPMIAFGIFLGYRLVPRLKQALFQRILLGIGAAGAVLLLF